MGSVIVRQTCMVFWGSHGCWLPPKHEGMHVCDCCPGDPEHLARHASADEDAYGVDGCAGNWPYYGGRVMEDPDMSLYFFGENFARMPGEFDRLRECIEDLQ